MSKKIVAPSAGVRQSSQLNSILGQLVGVVQQGERWTARCPAHRDQGLSLTITAETDGGAKIRCAGGCPGEAVAQALGHNDALCTLDEEVLVSGPDAVAPEQQGATGQRSKSRRERNSGTKVDAATLSSALGDVELFHSPEGEGFATVVFGDHRETYAIRSKALGLFIRRALHKKRVTVRSDVVNGIIEDLEAKAMFDGPEQQVYTRLAGQDGKIYLDLCNEKWEALEINADGWQVITGPPVKFRRAKGMLPLPYPVRGGSVKDLREFLNVASDGDFILVIAWLVAALRPTGPYPTLILTGEQGSAKSTITRLIRALVDPNTAPLRPLPRDERDLSIAAFNSWVQAFDNLSGVYPRMADTLCRLATGGGFATRELYTNRDEMLFDAARPVILNGIEPLAERPDLADRSVLIELPEIPNSKRRTEEEFWAKFEQARPRVVGALCDAVCSAIGNLPSTTLKSKPRMADFAVWSVAAETALPWEGGAFVAAYEANRADMAQATLDSDILSEVLRSYLTLQDVDTEQEIDTFEDTATVLYASLIQNAPEDIVHSPEWPKSPNKLSGRLRRLAPALRSIGIDVRFTKSNGQRLTKVRRVSKWGVSSDPCDPVSKRGGPQLVKMSISQSGSGSQGSVKNAVPKKVSK